MSKNVKGIVGRKRDHELRKDFEKAESRRTKAKQRAEVRRKELAETVRKGKKSKKNKRNRDEFNISPGTPPTPRIRREDVSIDEHTDSRKALPLYRLDGDTGWI